jgi:uridine monophosphate synthetase
MNLDAFALELHRVGAVKFGEFTLKSGRISPVYLDLRGLVSHPGVLRMAGEAFCGALRGLQFDRIAGLPYAGIPLAVSAALVGDLPMLYTRKEQKEYGTRKQVEGEFEAGQTVVLLDDVITDGGAKIELVPPFLSAGLVVRDVVVLCDREQGGDAALRDHGLQLHAVFTLRQLLEALRRQAAITEACFDEVIAYLDREAAAR